MFAFDFDLAFFNHRRNLNMLLNNMFFTNKKKSILNWEASFLYILNPFWDIKMFDNKIWKLTVTIIK